MRSPNRHDKSASTSTSTSTYRNTATDVASKSNISETFNVMDGCPFATCYISRCQLDMSKMEVALAYRNTVTDGTASKSNISETFNVLDVHLRLATLTDAKMEVAFSLPKYCDRCRCQVKTYPKHSA